jgi:site-specific recombinase XerD
MCGNSFARSGGRAERRDPRNTIQRHSESGRRNRERDALRNLGRSNESERSFRKSARFGRKRKQHVLEGKKLPESFRKPSVNFRQLVDDALAYSKRNKRSYNTDVPRLASLKEWFGSYPAEELTPQDIEKTLARAAEKEKWAASTFNHYRSLMSLSHRLGIRNRKVTLNPARSVTHRREDNNRVRFLTVEEERKLRKAIEAKWVSHVPELDLAINTSIRKGSQYSLTWDMVDFKGRMLNSPRTKNEEEPIHVPLNDVAIAALKLVYGQGGRRGRVFQSAKTAEPLENGRH